MSIAGFGALLDLPQLAGQMRHSIAEQSAQVAEANRRQRRVEMHHYIEQLAGTCEPGIIVVVFGGAVVRRRTLDRLVNSSAGLASDHAQQPAIVQALQQMHADIQVAAPALDAAMIE